MALPKHRKHGGVAESARAFARVRLLRADCCGTVVKCWTTRGCGPRRQAPSRKRVVGVTRHRALQQFDALREFIDIERQKPGWPESEVVGAEVGVYGFRNARSISARRRHG